MPDPGRGEQLEDRVEHAQPGSKHRDHDHVTSNHTTVSRPERRQDSRLFGRQLAQRLGRQEHADAIGRAAKRGRVGPHVTQFHQGIVNQWVFDEMKRHGHLSYGGRRIA